ncbi:hypothetical protein LTR16_000262, partial [Cryomyces antarcticus]
AARWERGSGGRQGTHKGVKPLVEASEGWYKEAPKASRFSVESVLAKELKRIQGKQTGEPFQARERARFSDQILRKDGPKDSGWDGGEVEHYDLVYTMVTNDLGLNTRVCKSKGLQLMVSESFPPAIGLSNKDAESDGTSKTVYFNKSIDVKWGTTLYKINETPRVGWQVIGV